MRIADLFGGNKYVAAINLYCAKYGITIPESEALKVSELLVDNTRFCVCIDKNGVELLPIRERSMLIGKIIGGRIKRGIVLYFHDGAYRTITPENWEETWKMLIPKVEKIVDDRIRVPKRERTMFDEAMPARGYKKMSKRGFSCTYYANEAMGRMQSINTKIVMG